MKLSMAVAALLGVLASPAWSATVTLRADTWCPFNCEPKGNPSGYVIEIAEYALAKKGHKIDYATMSWARTVQEAVAGNVDGAVAAGETDVTDNKLIVGKETVGISANCVYTKSSRSAIYKGAADLKNFKKIGTVKDYVYGDEIAAVFKANAGLSDEISGDDPPAMNIRKLKADRIDAIIEDSAVMAYTLKREKEQGVKNIGCDPKKIPLYLAFSPKNPKSIEYAAAVDAAVIDLRKSGKLKQILAKYGLKDWK